MSKMISDFEVSAEQEVAEIKMERPHIVVLGAGASRAVCPHGDKNGGVLPLMRDLTEVVGLKRLLERWGIDPDQDFEEIFSDLYERGEEEKVERIQEMVEGYFEDLELPDRPTIYDHLVLSLRDKDLLATFNWDPLLAQAYLRNRQAGLGLGLPKFAFLHGNVAVGYCEKDRVFVLDRVFQLAGRRCVHCGNPYTKAQLLYPIKQKNYSDNPFIANEWTSLKWGFSNAFMITIFGYSGPKTDQEAIEAMGAAWGDKSERALEQTEFITTQSEDEVNQNWDAFIHTHHYEVHADFYDSWIANHPRRTGEAYRNQYLEAKFIHNNPIPREMGFEQLWEWFRQFKEAEGVA
ncbi:MAG: hypothetical protein MUP14_05055 [Dehalococcoidia bacterium]|nr:hypothetical protein [Dehalococcoidia bacterium]